MVFDEKFFEGEEREGFFVEGMMKRAWAAQMEVLSEIDRVCKKYNLEWFADWGTLLGAVRHKGFIPWDDDMDITMKRKDYQKFAEVAEKELPKEFFVTNIYKDPVYSKYITRVVNSTKINFTEAHMKKYHGCPYVLGVDIYPLDYLPPNADDEDLLRNMIIATFDTARTINLEEMRGQAGEQLVQQIEAFSGRKFVRGKTLQYQLLRFAEELCSLYREDEATEIASMMHFVRNKRFRIPKEAYEKSVLVPFENIMMPIPVGYDAVLKAKYGDYMTPKICPTHDYPFYKKQQEKVGAYQESLKNESDK